MTFQPMCGACAQRRPWAEMLVMWIDADTGDEMVALMDTPGGVEMECWGGPAPVCLGCFMGDVRMAAIREYLRDNHERKVRGFPDG